MRRVSVVSARRVLLKRVWEGVQPKSTHRRLQLRMQTKVLDCTRSLLLHARMCPLHRHDIAGPAHPWLSRSDATGRLYIPASNGPLFLSRCSILSSCFACVYLVGANSCLLVFVLPCHRRLSLFYFISFLLVERPYLPVTAMCSPLKG